ncbi:MAG: high-affinity branched-chain amino acid ABC transporter permease LivM [Alphaproteobacteria bacterium]
MTAAVQDRWLPWRDAALVAGIAGVLALPLVGLRTIDKAEGLALEPRFLALFYLVVMIFTGRLLLGFVKVMPGILALVSLVVGALIYGAVLPEPFLRFVGVAGCALIFCAAVKQKYFSEQSLPRLPRLQGRGANAVIFLMMVCAALLPVTPLADRYVLDVMVMVLTYIALAFGLNMIVGYAGLLDLGYVAFYAIGAYVCALLGRNFDFGFWATLPCAALLAAVVAGIIGGPVLRLRGDYLAIVTLGFAEITRLALINLPELTGGPNGLSGIPRPTLFGLEFSANPRVEGNGFHDFFGIDFAPIQRMMFLYYLMLLVVCVVGGLSWALRRLPIGRAWEALREDEIACAAVGINRARVKLCAYMLGAMCAGLCGAFFAARQGFVSPESFTFAETSTILAIVVLGGVGHQLGIVLAALFVIGLPELFRELEQYRMLAFGAGMVLIMIWRPGGLMSTRIPGILLHPKKSR